MSRMELAIEAVEILVGLVEDVRVRGVIEVVVATELEREACFEMETVVATEACFDEAAEACFEFKTEASSALVTLLPPIEAVSVLFKLDPPIEALSALVEVVSSSIVPDVETVDGAFSPPCPRNLKLSSCPRSSTSPNLGGSGNALSGGGLNCPSRPASQYAFTEFLAASPPRGHGVL